jgi:putative transposase
VIEVDQFFASSKLCNICCYKNNELTLKDRSWVCLECGKNHDRDINAANNIKQEVMKIKIELSSPESTLQSIIYSMIEETKRKLYHFI